MDIYIVINNYNISTNLMFITVTIIILIIIIIIILLILSQFIYKSKTFRAGKRLFYIILTIWTGFMG